MRKVLSVLLSIACLFGMLSIIASAHSENNIELKQAFVNDQTYILGDADSNGSVNALDAYAIKAQVINEDTDSQISVDAADLDASGSITSKDAFYIKGILSGKISSASLESEYQVYSFSIGGSDLSDFVIVLPEGTIYDENIYCAYELLSKYAEKATGITLQREYGTTPEHGIYFNYATGELADELENDGYLYEVKDGSLYIYGTERGNMYAVYEILEKYFGFYFYDNYNTYSFKIRHSELPEGFSRQYVPVFSYRCVVGQVWGSTMMYYGRARRLNASSIGDRSDSAYYGYFVGPLYHNAHSFYFYEAMGAGEMPEDDGVTSLAERYYQKYQDGINHGVERGLVSASGKLLGDGPNAKQPCATNQTEFNLIYTGLIDTIHMLEARGYDTKFAEGITYISFSINDSSAGDGGYCQCKNCRAIALGSTVRIRDNTLKTDLANNFRGKYTTNGDSYTFNKEGYSGLYVNLASKAASKVQEEYEGLNLYMILYDHSVPDTVRPDEHLVLMYCGNGCNQHILGNGECSSSGGSLKYDSGYPAMSGKGYSNTYDEYALPLWVQYCHESGTKLYFWYYPVSYSTYLYDVPNIFNTYYDIKWLASIGLDGVYYEGASDGNEYLTECLKQYLAMEVEWNPNMTFDEYTSIMLKYMKCYYGKSYEYIYEAIVLLDEASNANGNCYYAAFDRVWDIYSPTYLDEHYDELIQLVDAILSVGRGSARAEKFAVSCEFLALSASYNRLYVNGDSASRSEYLERYTYIYNYIKNNGMKLYLGDLYTLPDTINLDSDPATQIYVITKR